MGNLSAVDALGDPIKANFTMLVISFHSVVTSPVVQMIIIERQIQTNLY